MSVCTLYDVGEQDGTSFLVMQYLEGETLEARLKKAALPLDQALQYAVQIADALATAHKAGIVHRDLKPGNVMLTKSGAKLLDFGLAKTGAAVLSGTNLSMLPTTPPITQQGSILGTLQYMAPEQLEGHEADARTDIFALGAVVYEMVTGKKAFEGTSHASLMGAILKDQPPPLTNMQPIAGPALDRVVQTCLAKNPEDRWQSARDLMRELTWMAQGDATAASSSAIRGGRPHARRMPLAWAMVILAVAAAVALAVQYERRPSSEPESLLRLTLPPPEGVELVAGQLPAIAPDGRRVALVGTEASGRRLLWIRALDAQVAYPLPGTDRAAWPFWSPDSRALGFFADGKLMTVEASGRATPLTLCTVNAGYGGSWSERGIIVFSHSSTGPLYRVTATGGSPAQVTTLQSERGEIGHLFPQFVDAQHFIFFVQAALQGAGGTYVADLQDPTRAAAQLSPAWASFVRISASVGAPTDRTSLLFVRDGTLMAQPFDMRALRLNGEPVAVAQQVAASGGVAVLGGVPMATASRNGVITYVSGGATRNTLTWFDRAGNRIGIFGPPGSYRDPALSPDGRTLVVARAPDGGGSLNLWLMDVERPTTPPQRFTSAEPDARLPSWKPDGSAVVFSASAKGEVGSYVKPISGADAQLLPQQGSTYAYDWSRDGRFLLLQLQRKLGNFDLAFMTLADRRIHPFVSSDLDGRSPKLSPEGRWVAYFTNESGVYDVFVRSFPSGDQKFQISTQGGARPLWSRDGRELFYIGFDGNLMAVPVKTTSPSFAWESPRNLFRTPVDTATLFNGYPYAVSPDSRRFLIVEPAQGSATTISLVLNWPALLKK